MKALYLIPGLVCLILSGIFLMVVHSIGQKQQEQDRNLTARAWGTLSDTKSRTERDIDKRTHTLYFGVYGFDTDDGRHVSVASDFGYHDPKQVPGTGGEPVEVLYDPKRPNEFVVSEEQAISRTVGPRLKSTGIVLTVIGLLLTLAAIAAILGVFDPLLEDIMG